MKISIPQVAPITPAAVEPAQATANIQNANSFGSIFTQTLQNMQAEIITQIPDVDMMDVEGDAILTSEVNIPQEIIQQVSIDNQNLVTELLKSSNPEISPDISVNPEVPSQENTKSIIEKLIPLSNNKTINQEFPSSEDARPITEQQNIIKPNENTELKDLSDTIKIAHKDAFLDEKDDKTIENIEAKPDHISQISTPIDKQKTDNNIIEENNNQQEVVKSGNLEKNSSLQVQYKYDPSENKKTSLPDIFKDDLKVKTDAIKEEKPKEQQKTTIEFNKPLDSSNNEFTENFVQNENMEVQNIEYNNNEVSEISKDNADQITSIKSVTTNNNDIKPIKQIPQAATNLYDSKTIGNTSPVQDQISFAITKNLSTGNNKIIVHLEPQELGKVEISLNMVENNVSKIHVIADKLETLEILHNDHKLLEKGLSDSGLKISSDNISFSLSYNNNPNDNNNQREFLENNRAFLKSLNQDMLASDDVIISSRNNMSERLLDIVV